jgi:hypothetical protein
VVELEEQENINETDSAPVVGKHASRMIRMFNKPRTLGRPKTAMSGDNDWSSQHSVAEFGAPPKSAESTKTVERFFRRPRTASDAPSFPRRSRADTLGAPGREGSFIVFSVRKQGNLTRDEGEDKGNVKMTQPMLDQPLQLSPPPLSEDRQKMTPSSTYANSAGGRLRTASSHHIMGNRKSFDGARMSRSSFSGFAEPNFMTQKETSQVHESVVRQEGSIDGSVKSSPFVKALRQRGMSGSTASPKSDHRRAVTSVDDQTNGEILALPPMTPWSGSPYYQPSASGSMYSLPQRSSPLIRSSIVAEHEERLSPLRRANVSPAAGEEGAETDLQGRPKTMKFRSWIAWRGNRGKQRDSEVEMERALAMAEADLYSDDNGPRTGSRAGSSAGSKSGTFATMQKGRKLRGSPTEFFGKLRHPDRDGSMSASAGESSVATRPMTDLPKTALPALYGHKPTNEEGRRDSNSECLEEVASAAHAARTITHTSSTNPSQSPPPPPPPPHVPSTASQPWLVGACSNTLFKRVPAHVGNITQDDENGDPVNHFHFADVASDWHVGSPSSGAVHAPGVHDLGKWHDCSDDPRRGVRSLHQPATAPPTESSTSRIYVGSPRP